MPLDDALKKGGTQVNKQTYTFQELHNSTSKPRYNTHQHTIYIYICVCVRVCVCANVNILYELKTCAYSIRIIYVII